MAGSGERRVTCAALVPQQRSLKSHQLVTEEAVPEVLRLNEPVSNRAAFDPRRAGPCTGETRQRAGGARARTDPLET